MEVTRVTQCYGAHRSDAVSSYAPNYGSEAKQQPQQREQPDVRRPPTATTTTGPSSSSRYSTARAHRSLAVSANLNNTSIRIKMSKDVECTWSRTLIASILMVNPVRAEVTMKNKQRRQTRKRQSKGGGCRNPLRWRTPLHYVLSLRSVSLR